MQAQGNKGNQGVRGSATVEFALISTLMVPILMFSMYLFDLGRVRIKTAEVARYTAWEMTSFPLSDYQNARHNDYFKDAERAVTEDVATRFGDDLRADTVNGQAIEFTTGRFSLSASDIRLKNESVRFSGGGGGGAGDSEDPILNELWNVLNQGSNSLFGLFKFNTKGQIRADVTIYFHNSFLPRWFAQEFYENEMAPRESAGGLRLTDHLSLIADSWTLLDGDNVYPWGFYTDKPQADSKHALLYQQVNRITMAGLVGNLLGDGWEEVMQSIQEILSQIPGISKVVDLEPWQTRVASVASQGTDEQANDTNKIKINVDCGEGSKSKGLHTTPIRYDCFQVSEDKNVWLKRGYYYMGCKQAQQYNCNKP